MFTTSYSKVSNTSFLIEFSKNSGSEIFEVIKNCMFLLAVNLLEIRPAVAISEYIGVNDKGIYIGIDKSYYKPEVHLFFLKILKIYLVNCIVTWCITSLI